MVFLKAAAFDLDDTLLHDDLSISPYTLDVFHRLADQGFFFIADSGRTRLSMKPHVEKIGCVALYIACNGAEIYDGVTHELLHAENYSMEMAHEIVDFGAEYHAYAQAYDDGHFYFNQYSVYSERYARTSSLSGIYVGDLRKFIREPRNKILMMAEPDQIAEMLAEARRRSDEMVERASREAKALDEEAVAAMETERLRRAKEATAEFVQAVEAQIARQQQALEALKSLDLPVREYLPKSGRKAYDYEAEKDEPRIRPEQPEPPRTENAEDIAAQIEKSVADITGDSSPRPKPDLNAPTRVMPVLDERTTAKFANLKFGKNYQP